MFRVNPPPMFLRVKFGKKCGGNTRVNTVSLVQRIRTGCLNKVTKFPVEAVNVLTKNVEPVTTMMMMIHGHFVS
jgi:hypothetical protein